MKPSPNTYPPYFNNYIKLISENDVQSALKNQTPIAEHFFNLITEEQSTYKYAEEKWTVKEILQHVIDAERVFAYRSLTFARRDNHILHPFDENDYAAYSNANNRTWKELIEEFMALRRSTELLFHSFTEENLNTEGKASDYTMTVLALGYVIAGHLAHHIHIIRERYLAI
ncbi:MAG: DinB family protein [Ginsengibacter sp.]